MFAVAYVAALWPLAGFSMGLWFWLSDFRNSRHGSGSITYDELLSVSLPILVDDAMRLVTGWTDTIMIGLFCSELDLAAYSVVLQVSALITLPLMAVNSIAAPKFAEFHACEDRAGLVCTARQSTRIAFWLSVPIVGIVLVFSRQLLGIFDSDLTFGALALIIVGLGQFFNVLSGSVGPILNMTGQQLALRNIILLSGILNVVLNCMLIPYYGIGGAAIATCLTLVLSNVLALYKIKNKFNFVPLYVPLLFKS